MTFRGSDVVSTILAFAREYSIRVIVIGQSRLQWYHRLFHLLLRDLAVELLVAGQVDGAQPPLVVEAEDAEAMADQR